MGKLQQEEVVRPLPANNPSQAIVDVVENMRAKIHALFCKMGYTELPGMTTEDYVTLTIIEQYLNLKVNIQLGIREDNSMVLCVYMCVLENGIEMTPRSHKLPNFLYWNSKQKPISIPE